MPAAESTALRALGLAARGRRQMDAAIVWLKAAINVAEQASELDLAAEARVSLAATLAFTGDTRGALKTLDGARPSKRVALVVASNRVGILTMLGRYDEAVGGYDQVVSAFRRLGDRPAEGRALISRGLLHVYTGRFGQADSDLARAEQLLAEAGYLTEAASCCHNRGFAAARRGDLPGALAFFDRAGRRFSEAGVPTGHRALDRGDLLLSAGLIHEAKVVVADCLAYLRSGGDQASLAEGLVLLASVAHLSGKHAEARASATEAAALFTAQSRPGWAALAQTSIARARLAELDQHPAPNELGKDTALAKEAALTSEGATELERLGLAGPAVEAHAVAGQLWLAIGRAREADVELTRASAGRRGGTASIRLVAWEAEAVRRLHAGDRKGALGALRCCLSVVDSQQACLAATELRAHVSIHAESAAKLGLRLVVESGRPRQVLAWMELRRANSLRSWPVRPPLDDVLAAQLAELRAIVHDSTGKATSGSDVRPSLRRQAQLERSIRERAWQVTHDRGGPGGAGLRRVTEASGGSVNELVQALGDGVLIEVADSDGVLHAVVLAGGRCSCTRLGPTAEVLAALNHLRFDLRRLAYGMDPSDTARPTTGQVRKAARDLDDLLLGRLRGLIGDRPAVVVPTGELHATPWAALPTLAGRPTTVAPSARAWLRAATTKRPNSGHVVVVSGPRLPGATAEAGAVARIYPGATVLSGRRAKAAAVTRALEGADVAHVAAHATFRADNGLWSALELADGPLTVYELEALQQPPTAVVLSACQSGLSSLRPGDELLGLVAALIALGTHSVIASVLPVADKATVAFMVAVHEHLSTGLKPAAALASAQATSTDPTVAASFVCFGAG